MRPCTGRLRGSEDRSDGGGCVYRGDAGGLAGDWSVRVHAQPPCMNRCNSHRLHHSFTSKPGKAPQAPSHRGLAGFFFIQENSAKLVLYPEILFGGGIMGGFRNIDLGIHPMPDTTAVLKANADQHQR